MPSSTTRGSSSEAIRMEPLGGRTSTTTTTRSPGQNGNAKEVPVNSGDSNPGLHKRGIYEHNGVTVCSQKRALCVATLVFAILFLVSLIIAFAGPQNDCPCAGEKPSNYNPDDDEGGDIYATNGELFPWNNVRLPTFVRPLRYELTIHPNLTTLEVKGQVVIEINVERDTEFIVFHSKNLTITEKMVKDKKDNILKIEELLEYPKHQQIYLELEDTKFQKNANYTIHLRFVTRLSNELEGFYLSSYFTPEGEKRFLATTHFEPTYARSAFPCFDEPQFKARFKISIFRDRFHIALCNMPVMNTEDAGFYMGTGLLKDDFQESVEMSTYLVAFVVCDFKKISELTKKNVSVSVYAAEHMLPQAKYAASTAAKIMDFYESFFGVPYPLPKQDLIAIPDFAAGAMENWGLITYRETSILYDPKETSTANHEWIAIVIAHELSHQWFGDLVTMKWWNDLWLNEGASSFFESKGVDFISPMWSMMDQFTVDKTQPALAFDALAISHPISVAVKDPSDIESIFDAISYNKGASILNMLENFLGEDVLRNGLNDYLETHAYGNADTNDLWSVFSKHANQTFDVKAIMDTWTQQMGFPLVEISREGNTITAVQRRFLVTAAKNTTDLSKPKTPFNYKWYVPLSYYTNKEPNKFNNVWMNMTDVTFEVEEDVEFIKCNVNQTGFYRVTYTPEMWDALIKTLFESHAKFSPADRANLIDDAFTLCEAGELNASVPLRLAIYLTKERDYIPWATALNHLLSWKRNLGETPGYKKYVEYMRRILTPVASYVGWEDEGPHLKKLLRGAVLHAAVVLELEDVVKPAKRIFQDWMKQGKRVAPNIRDVVYVAGIQFGAEEEWNYSWDKYTKTQIPSEKKVLLYALGSTRDRWLLQQYLSLVTDRDKIRPQDVDTVIGAVARNPEGHFFAWRYFKAHWSKITTLFGIGSPTMSDLIKTVTIDFFTEYDYQEVTEFFGRVEIGGSKRALEQSLERIKLNIHWVQTNAQIVDQWLFKYLNSTSS